MIERTGLEMACRIPGTNGLKPHPTQNLAAVPALLRHHLQAGHPRGLIVLAVDGLGLDAARAHWSPSTVVPLTSTFPSTSCSAWLTATTGMTVEQHMVPGVTYHCEEAGGLYNCLFDCIATGNGEGNGRPPTPGFQLGPWPTIFQQLGEEGVECVAHLGDMASLPPRWPHAVLRGATFVPPVADWNEIRFQPQSMAESTIAEIDSTLNRAHGRGPLLSWSHINIDEYIHLHGTDQAVGRFLEQMQRAVERWVRSGYTVMAHSDHGLVATRSSPHLNEEWRELNQAGRCFSPPGGAGRVRWVYPRPEYEQEMRDRLAEVFAGQAMVVTQADLETMGLLRLNDTLRKRIGSIIVIATGEDFVGPEGTPRRFEHGSFTHDEMLAMLAVWTAR